MTFEEELLSSINDLIKSGDIVVEREGDQYFTRFGNTFPICGSKIDWDEVPGSIEEVAKDGDYLGSCLKFFTKICEEKLLRDRIIVIGDNAIDSVLKMPIEILAINLKKILEIPQHTYLLAEDYSWCMSFTMEGDMAFGFKP